ncbi:diguanylate cyclase (GGDEF) domain-containing protein [Atopomonas hussainii]|uniref:diguanylate cyclase n=1 Tax=Atopomonas hussainii TaxID=1429083 RepID=A0A1H7S502_9GAMM|nr:diguanylate cyclase [Atopomonas hussainii]SEL67585.1 diguanylate cyclase (GGDEF) domain-containing protein [Atopomonas hussainii]
MSELPNTAELDDNHLDKLRQHFAQRVSHQAQMLLEAWIRLNRSEWNSEALAELEQGCERLAKSAQRFEQGEHAELAEQLHNLFAQVRDNRNRPNSGQIQQLHSLMQQLSKIGMRLLDDQGPVLRPGARKPVYVCLQDQERAERIVQQLKFFGMRAQALDKPSSFQQAITDRHPSLLMMDVDFGGPSLGLSLAQHIQDSRPDRLPIVFYSPEAPDTRTQLAAVRAGGQALLSGNIDPARLLEKLDALTCQTLEEPYRVLIVDDSRAQAMFTEQALNGVGILTYALTEPLKVMDALRNFSPDLIILDMYMPECMGPELARMIRQHERYVSTPIIFLSAEDDLDKQLVAMGEGGDDFLTKPIRPRHLVTTVRHRADRARTLKQRMVCDSLTGLYNHTHTLQLLEDALHRAQQNGEPVSFAMLDIDFFKKINDSHGHPAGDRVIKSLALFLKQRLRRTDSIGRYGGEEFAVIMPDTDSTAALHVLDEIRRRFSDIHHPVPSGEIISTFSAGVATSYDGNDLSAQQLCSFADEALYQAKHGGRNQVCCHTHRGD